MKFNAATLPNTPEALKQIIAELHGQLDTLQAAHQKETSLLHEQIRHLRAQLFGPKSEKITSDSSIQILPLFDMPEPEECDAEPEKINIEGHQRSKKGRRPLPEDLPRVEQVHDIDESEKTCGCGCRLVRIGEEVSEQLDIVPARMQVIRHIRPKYACKACEGEKNTGAAVKVAPVHPQIIPRSMATAGLLAFILTGKFIDHLPFYRQEKQFTRLGVDISRTSMCNWAMRAAEACIPLLNLLHDALLDGNYLAIDETPVQVLKEPGRSPRTKSYMWVFRRGDPDKSPIIIYQYQPTREGDVVRHFLGDFSGYIQSDGYSGYAFLDTREGVRHIGCLAHVRRKFNDIVKAQGKKRKSGAADVALSFISKLYKLERQFEKQHLGSDEIYQQRQNYAKPILKDFHQWLLKQSARTLPKGLLGQAVTYALNQWDRVKGYVEHGALRPDNNLTENCIRPFAVGRKNWLFAGTPQGAEASSALYSLIETAKANTVEPYSYLRYIFEKLPLAATLEDYEALLPWNAREECARTIV
nr:IS66 family transposase [uncultured Desulfobulbus sp.]